MKKMIFFKKIRTSSVVGAVFVAIAVAAIVDADAKEMSFEMRENWEGEGELELEKKNREAYLARLGAKILKPSNQYNLCHLRIFLSTKISLG